MANKIQFIAGWNERYKELCEMFGFDGVYAFGTPDPIYYTCGSIEGLCIRFPDGRLDIIAIFNNRPHNGDFELFMLALEKWGRNTGKVRICSFFNQKLYHKIKARPGWSSTVGTMGSLEYEK